MADIPVAKQFNLNLLAQGLQFIHYVVLGDQMILLPAIIHAEAKEDGSLMLSMANGIDLPLTVEEVEVLENLLKKGIEQAQSMAARKAATDLGLVTIPGRPN
jgi:hypothetical protein